MKIVKILNGLKLMEWLVGLMNVTNLKLRKLMVHAKDVHYILDLNLDRCHVKQILAMVDKFFWKMENANIVQQILYQLKIKKLVLKYLAQIHYMY